MHTGNLQHDSPSLYSNILRYLSEDEVLKISLAYALAAKHGALAETGVVRTPGASYNPRPARVAQILMTEIREYNSDTLCCAILGCTRIEDQIDFPETLASVKDKFLELREALKSPNEPPETSPTEACLYAILLDEIRHLHMTDFPIDIIMTKTEHIQNLIDNKDSFKENLALVKKIKHALEKLQNFIQSAK